MGGGKPSPIPFRRLMETFEKVLNSQRKSSTRDLAKLVEGASMVYSLPKGTIQVYGGRPLRVLKGGFYPESVVEEATKTGTLSGNERESLADVGIAGIMVGKDLKLRAIYPAFVDPESVRANWGHYSCSPKAVGKLGTLEQLEAMAKITAPQTPFDGFVSPDLPFKSVKEMKGKFTKMVRSAIPKASIMSIIPQWRAKVEPNNTASPSYITAESPMLSWRLYIKVPHRLRENLQNPVGAIRVDQEGNFTNSDVSCFREVPYHLQKGTELYHGEHVKHTLTTWLGGPFAERYLSQLLIPLGPTGEMVKILAILEELAPHLPRAKECSERQVLYGKDCGQLYIIQPHPDIKGSACLAHSINQPHKGTYGTGCTVTLYDHTRAAYNGFKLTPSHRIVPEPFASEIEKWILWKQEPKETRSLL